MRHLWPGLCGSLGGKPDGTFQSICCVPEAPGASIGDPTFIILVVLNGLLGAIASDGLPTQSWTVILSSPGVWQFELAGFRWNLTSTGLTCPGSALSGPETGPVNWMSGLSHHVPAGSCVPPSPVTASIKKQVSPARPG